MKVIFYVIRAIAAVCLCLIAVIPIGLGKIGLYIFSLALHILPSDLDWERSAQWIDALDSDEITDNTTDDGRS